METRKTIVKTDGSGVAEALRQTELVGEAYRLPHKDALHLRLLAEEMMGMLSTITGDMNAWFFIREEGDVFSLHLVTETGMAPEKREQLLSVSTSGKNAAAKGVMGKLRDVFETALSYGDMAYGDYAVMSLGLMASPGSQWLANDAAIWSLNNYKAGLAAAGAGASADEDKAEAWDELEKSIVARIADEVKVAIRGNEVEMIITKKF